jgi:alpha-glucosidase
VARGVQRVRTPRTAVAEAWVDRARLPRYASADSLGQAFNFDLLRADFEAGQFRHIVTENLDLAAASGSSSTWVLSNHDVVRHPSRYGLPPPARDTDGRLVERHGLGWISSGGTEPALDRSAGLRRARAATMFVLGLPGSTYLYQGEQLGLHEVAAIPASHRQDPTFLRTDGADPGRDGCRVPLPWTSTGPSLGFGTAGPHLPQPPWFAASAADAQDADPDSVLSLYRHALRLRHQLRADEALDWIETGRDDVLRYRRPNGWEIVTNFGTTPYPLDHADVILATADAPTGYLPGESTVWTLPHRNGVDSTRNRQGLEPAESDQLHRPSTS